MSLSHHEDSSTLSLWTPLLCAVHTPLLGWSQDPDSSRQSFPISGSIVPGSQRGSDSTIPLGVLLVEAFSLRHWGKLERQREFWGHEKDPKSGPLAPKSGLHFSRAKRQEPQHNWQRQEDCLKDNHPFFSEISPTRKFRKTDAPPLLKAKNILWSLRLTLSGLPSGP